MAALYANECLIPDKKIVINLSPAEERKNSPIFDLAMAIGMMKEAGEFKDDIPSKTAFLGVLSLDGTIKPVDGMLLALIAARGEGFKAVYLPYMPEMSLKRIEGIELRFVETLADVITSFSGQLNFKFQQHEVFTNEIEPAQFEHQKDFKHVIGHEQ